MNHSEMDGIPFDMSSQHESDIRINFSKKFKIPKIFRESFLCVFEKRE